MHGVMTPSRCAGLRPESKGSQRREYKRFTNRTYIGLLAYIIQDSPNKMLTFRQIMEKLSVFVSGDKKGLENNIRVCLSSNKCFVKEPVNPDYPNAKRNFWKVDESCITPKMLRRHFSDMTSMLPGLTPQWQGKCESGAVQDPPTPASKRKGNNQPRKFSSPFSIESLLKKDHTSPPLIPPVQDRGGLCDFRLTPTSSSSVCWKDPFYSYTHLDYIYSSAVAGLSETPAVRKDSSPSQLSYDQTVLSKLSSASPLSHDLRYLRW